MIARRRLICVMITSLAAGLGLAAVGCERADEYDLVIITPHNKQIQTEFQTAFEAEVGQPVRIRWVLMGTGEIMQLLGRNDRPNRGFDYDIMFGGGAPDYELGARRGYFAKPNLPAEVVEAVPATLGGLPTRDPNGLWYGATMSTFGILVNEAARENQNLPEINDWADLARPEMFSWIIAADPSKSGSVRVCYELILQKYGWERGWPMLLEIAANARQITDSSSAIPNEVTQGSVVAGPTIDFYALQRMEKNDRLRFVLPPGGTAATPDPIAMLRQPKHKAMAERFIAFVLSPAGQRLWFLPPGVEGGPREARLFRTPISPAVMEQHAEHLPIKDLFASLLEFDAELQSRRSPLLQVLFPAAAVTLHDELRETWEALNEAGMPAEAMEAWNEPMLSNEAALSAADEIAAAEGPETRAELNRTWYDAYAAKYARVQQLVAGE